MNGREVRDAILWRQPIDPVGRLDDGDEAFALGSDRVACHAAFDRTIVILAPPSILKRSEETGIADEVNTD